MSYQSILHGCDDIIDGFFGVTEAGKYQRYGTRTTYLLHDLETRTGDPLKLLGDLHARVTENWTDRAYRKVPSGQNWRCKYNVDYKQDRKGLEVKLEREIVKAMGVGKWMNNVPTASGCCGPSHDKARNIDLVHRLLPDTFTFIELKWRSNTPVFAAIEILLRGVLNCFTRLHLDEMNYGAEQLPMLTVPHVELRVLAPHSYYHRDVICLRWLEEKLNFGLSQYARRFGKAGVTLDFAFESFSDTLVDPFISDAVRGAMALRTRAYP